MERPNAGVALRQEIAISSIDIYALAVRATA